MFLSSSKHEIDVKVVTGAPCRRRRFPYDDALESRLFDGARDTASKAALPRHRFSPTRFSRISGSFFAGGIPQDQVRSSGDVHTRGDPSRRSSILRASSSSPCSRVHCSRGDAQVKLIGNLPGGTVRPCRPSATDGARPWSPAAVRRYNERNGRQGRDLRRCEPETRSDDMSGIAA